MQDVEGVEAVGEVGVEEVEVVLRRLLRPE
jgi:hypothetical protein